MTVLAVTRTIAMPRTAPRPASTGRQRRRREPPLRAIGPQVLRRGCRWPQERLRLTARARCRREATSPSVLPQPPGEPGRDLLEQPAVAVRIAEPRVGE